MKIKLFSLVTFLSLIVFLFGCKEVRNNPNILWTDKPAEYFEEAFPLGNGFSGMMIRGGVPSEDILLNESTLWTGGPVDANMNRDGWKSLAGVRKALFSENYKLAEQLIRKMQGKFSESFAPFGNLKIDFSPAAEPTGYRRSLDFGTGIATVEYSGGNIKYLREYFISNPDRVAVIKLSSEKASSLSFTISATSQLRYKTSASDSSCVMDGTVPVHA
jgi:alpha-L-fucosidase 2